MHTPNNVAGIICRPNGTRNAAAPAKSLDTTLLALDWLWVFEITHFVPYVTQYDTIAPMTMESSSSTIKDPRSSGGATSEMYNGAPYSQVSDGEQRKKGRKV